MYERSDCVAKQPKVKCPVCQEQFYREDVPFIKIKNRYYHQSCYEAQEKEKSEEEKERELLTEYIKKLFNISVLTVKINKQIKDLLEKNYSYKGIRMTLMYWFDVKGNSIEKANGGIGIVPYVYEQALIYWKSIWEAQQYNKSMNSERIEIPVREIHIPIPERRPMKTIRKLFTFLEEGDSVE